MKPKGKPVKWSSKVAYAVGLITTDGNLSPDGRHINLTSKDKEQVDNFKFCLGLKNKIGRKSRGGDREKKYYVLQFGDVIFYRWLVDLGLMPNKSKIVGALKIPNEHFFHFLRGCLDGDGCIRKYQDKVFPNSQRLYVTFNCASFKHLQWLQKTIKNLSNLNGRLRGDRKNGVMYVLVFARKESLKLLPLIYPNENVPRLIRKYSIVESFL